MSDSFGNHARVESELDLEEGEHAALISKAVLPRDDEGEFIQSYGKDVCDVSFAINGDESQTVRRRYAVTFGQNTTTGTWAAFAELLAAACGVPCGAKNQRQLGTQDLEGQNVRVVLKKVEKNGREYLNVINVLAPRKGAKPTPEGGQVQGSKERFKFEGPPPPEIEEEIAF